MAFNLTFHSIDSMNFQAGRVARDDRMKVGAFHLGQHYAKCHSMSEMHS